MHTISKNDQVLAAPAWSLSIYFGLPSEEQRQALTELWLRLLPLYRSKLRWYITESMPFKEPVDQEVLAMIPLWFEPEMPLRRRYLLFSHEGASRDSISPWACELYVYDTVPIPPENKRLVAFIGGVPEEEVRPQANCIRFSFPPDSKDFSLADFLALSTEVFQSFPFVHANAGYSLVFEYNLSAMMAPVWSEVASIAFRHPGYDLFEYLSVHKFVFDKIKTVNWLTMLGDPLAAGFKQSGRAALLHSSEIVTTWGDNRVLIQAGGRPAIGDVNRGDRLPLYREVASALDPWLCKHHFPFSRMFDADKTDQWLHRFSPNE